MTTLFNVKNMKCAGCSANVQTTLADVAGIDSVMVDLGAKTVRVEGDIVASEIAEIISNAGYPAEVAQA